MSTITRRGAIAASGSGGGASIDPVAYGTPHTAFWAEDPIWNPPADGGEVTLWRNGGSNGQSFVKVTATGPTYRASVAALNGHPAVEFAGAHTLATDFLSDQPIAPPYTLAVVVLPPAGAGNASSIWSVSSSSNLRGLVTTASNTFAGYFGGAIPSDLDGGVVANEATFVMVRNTTDAGQDTISVNGSVVETGDSGDGSIQKHALGGATSGLTRFWTGHIAYGWFKKEIASSEVEADLFAWAQDHYAIS